MKIDKTNCNCAGIYVIKNSINNKIYVGKSKNCYKRLHQHLSDIKIDNRNYNENPHLLNSFKKYGKDNFEYYIIEKIDICDDIEKILAERELYWMLELNSLDRNKGYNLRYDSEGKCFCSEETSQKITTRLKKEWEEGIRDEHSNKMKKYWDGNDKRKEEQSKIMSKNKTKYVYDVYDNQNQLIIANGYYKDLKEIDIHKAVGSAFYKIKNTENKDEVVCKGYTVIRKNNKDIVQP